MSASWRIELPIRVLPTPTCAWQRCTAAARSFSKSLSGTSEPRSEALLRHRGSRRKQPWIKFEVERRASRCTHRAPGTWGASRDCSDRRRIFCLPSGGRAASCGGGHDCAGGCNARSDCARLRGACADRATEAPRTGNGTALAPARVSFTDAAGASADGRVLGRQTQPADVRGTASSLRCRLPGESAKSVCQLAPVIVTASANRRRCTSSPCPSLTSIA